MVLLKFDEYVIFNEVYENWKKTLPKKIIKIYEGYSEYDDDLSGLNDAERRALERGLDVMSEEQMDAAYLAAKEVVEGNSYLNMIDGIDGFGKYDEEGKFTITKYALADAVGLKVGTLQRAVNKFLVLFGEKEEDASEILYPKIVEAFEKREKENTVQLANNVGGILRDPATSTINRDAEEERQQEMIIRREARREEEEGLGAKIYELISGLKARGMMVERAVPYALDEISLDLGINEKRLRSVYHRWLKEHMPNKLDSHYDR